MLGAFTSKRTGGFAAPAARMLVRAFQ